MSAAYSAWVLIDPAQDYEESIEIHGVYGSLKAAQVAARLVRSRMADYTWWRELHVEHWIGGEVVERWEQVPGPRSRTFAKNERPWYRWQKGAVA